MWVYYFDGGIYKLNIGFDLEYWHNNWMNWSLKVMDYSRQLYEYTKETKKDRLKWKKKQTNNELEVEERKSKKKVEEKIKKQTSNERSGRKKNKE